MVAGEKMILNKVVLKDNSSVSYGSGGYIKGEGLGSGTGNIKFNIPFGIETESTYNLLIGESTGGFESDVILPNNINVLNFPIYWKAEVRDSNNAITKVEDAGVTNSKAYITLNTPIPSICPVGANCASHPGGLYESVLNISCSAAKGKSTETDAFNTIWNEVKDLNLETLDGRTLKYYGAGINTIPPNYSHNSTAALLETSDDRCGMWASFFEDLLKIQGIEGVGKEVFYIAENESRNLKRNPQDPSSTRVYYKVNNYYSDIVSLRQRSSIFQGGGDPSPVPFQDHVVNSYNNKIYDATSGKGAYNNLLEYVRQETYIKVNLGTTPIIYEYNNLSYNDFIGIEEQE